MYKQEVIGVEIASDFLKYGEQVEIVADCPLRGLKGELAYVSEESLQVEVFVAYEESEKCSSYFTGYTKDIKKVDVQTNSEGAFL
jgi:hypothetical protein